MTNLEKSLQVFNEKIIKDMKSILTTKGKDASGDLLNSFKLLLEETDTLHQSEIELATHGIYVDKGRRAGRMPPADSIRKWVNEKGIRGNGISQESLIYLIRRKIGVRGIDPTPFLHLFYNMGKSLAAYLEKPAAKDMQKSVDTIVIEFNKNNN